MHQITQQLGIHYWFNKTKQHTSTHVTPLEGGSPVGGHGDVFSGGSPWTVTGPLFDLFDLLVFSCAPVMLILTTLPQTSTHEHRGDGHAYSRPTTLARCIDTLSNYGSGREPCTAKALSPRLGVLSGFVFQRRSPGDTTLSESRQPRCQGSLRLARHHTIGSQLYGQGFFPGFNT